MKKITFYIETGFVGADYEVTEEFDDDIKASELDEFAEDFLNNHINYGWFEEENENAGRLIAALKNSRLVHKMLTVNSLTFVLKSCIIILKKGGRYYENYSILSCKRN